MGAPCRPALKAGDEPLAREALIQKKRIVAERDRAEALRAEQGSTALNMKAELERMEAKHAELAARKGTLAVELRNARAGGGAEALGSRAGAGNGAFSELRRMEEQVDGQAAEIAAAREVEDALRSDHASHEALESKFAALERGSGAGASQDKAISPELDDELTALKKKLRIG